ncbi:MAG: alpha/beta hydrolase [Pseudomonadota bacterium]
MHSAILIVCGLLVFIYLSLCLAAHLMTPKNLFKPQPCSYTMHSIPNGYFVTLADNTKIAVSYSPIQHAKYVIFFNHGNRADIGYSLHYCKYFNDIGFSFLIYDYPGYGCSTGTPNIKGIESSVLQVYDDFIQRFSMKPEQIIAYGRSLGGGPSIYLAENRRVAGLITDGTFMSVYRIKTRWPILLGDKLKNILRIKKVQAPYYSIHGLSDTLVNPVHAQKLYDSATTEKMRWWVPGYKHDEHPVEFPDFQRNLMEFVRLIESKH